MFYGYLLILYLYLAGVELDESLFPKRALYCGGPLGGAKLKQKKKKNHGNAFLENLARSFSSVLS